MKTGYDIGNAYQELKSWYLEKSSLGDVEGCLSAARPFLFTLFFESSLIDVNGFKEADANFQDFYNVLMLYLFSGLLKRKEFLPLRKRKLY